MIPRFPPEVYVDKKRVYYVRDSKDKSYWAQNTRGEWRAMTNPGVEKPADWKPYVPPAPKEKKEKGPPTNYSKRYQRFDDVEYGRPWQTKRRRRRDPDADAEGGESL